MATQLNLQAGACINNTLAALTTENLAMYLQPSVRISPASPRFKTKG